MNEFTNINALAQQFKSGDLIEIPQSFVVDGVNFTYVDEVNIKLHKSVSTPNKPKSTVVYESQDTSTYIVFIWNLNERLQSLPTSVVQVDANVLVELDHRDVARHYDEKTVGTSLDIILMGLNDNQPVKGKIDTGAELCSLDAQNIRIVQDPADNGELVKFTFGEKIYTVLLKEQQAVQTADGGVNYRPVISLSVKVNGQVYTEVLFNLNDRSDMPDPILLGLNFLKKTDFLIDPKKESIEWNLVTKLAESIVVELPIEGIVSPAKDDQINQLLESIYNSPDISLADILRKMKSDTIKTLEGIQH